jgi:hypothetical protein
MIARHERSLAALARTHRISVLSAWMLLAFVVGCLLELSCTMPDRCPPAELSAINARYLARAALACKGQTRATCDAYPQINAARLAEEKDAGCF